MGATSNELATTTDNDTVPGAPQTLVAISISNSEIGLSWDVPVSNGGDTITGYQIEREQLSPTTVPFAVIVADTGSPGTTHSDMGLTPGGEYNYRVSAINSVDTGASSNESAATTMSGLPNASVSSIVYFTVGGQKQDKHLGLDITVESGVVPIPNASVSVDLFLDSVLVDSFTGTTDAFGLITFQHTNAPTGLYTTTVTDVTVTGFVWAFNTPSNSFNKVT